MIFRETGEVKDSFFVLGSADNPIYLLKSRRPVLFDAGLTVLAPAYEKAIRTVLQATPPEMILLTPSCRNTILDDFELLEIISNSTAVIAAHQHLTAKGIRGYINEDGKADYINRKDYIKLGNYTINNFINK